MFAASNNLDHTTVTPNLSNQNTLLIKHSDGWNNDRCEKWLQDHGASIQSVICNGDFALPDPDKFDRVIVYGGLPCISDKAYQNHLHIEAQFIEGVLKKNIPCLGICLGAQLIAHVLGAKVQPLPCGSTEFGFSTITPTRAGIAPTRSGIAFMPQPCKMMQWHCEGFDLPSHCELLATSDTFPNQAFRYADNTYGVQFHPEVTTDILAHWHNRFSQDRRIPVSEIQRYQQQRDCKNYADHIDQWFNNFMHLWITAPAPE